MLRDIAVPLIVAAPYVLAAVVGAIIATVAVAATMMGGE